VPRSHRCVELWTKPLAIRRVMVEARSLLRPAKSHRMPVTLVQCRTTMSTNTVYQILFFWVVVLESRGFTPDTELRSQVRLGLLRKRELSSVIRIRSWRKKPTDVESLSSSFRQAGRSMACLLRGTHTIQNFGQTRFRLRKDFAKGTLLVWTSSEEHRVVLQNHRSVFLASRRNTT
jgi:hypothetical protein